MKNEFFLLLISSLAVWRVTELITIDSGPFHIFKWLRVNARRIGPKTGELVSCPYCVSIHAAMWVTAYLWWLGLLLPWHTPLWWLGIAGGAVAVMRSVRERV